VNLDGSVTPLAMSAVAPTGVELPALTAEDLTAASSPDTTSLASWKLPSAGRVGMFALIAAEAAVFVIFIVAYAFYLGNSLSGPTPAILTPPVFISVCLLSSSATLEIAIRSLKRGSRAAFTGWWLLTIALGAIFLTGTGLEWRHLMVDEGLLVSTNLFGTTFYSLVGLHGLHVTIGLILMAIVAAFMPWNQVTRAHADQLELISLYWHFVDSVWVVVFTLIYVLGR
jgi:cytochrome c oxidase subunit 3/cytochrome o ubiquinol oxidase subunit 3